jgi:hypothetical protein
MSSKQISMPISGHLPPFVAQALAQAAQASDIKAIDAITDKLAAEGKCRPRGDCSMLGELRAGSAP